MTTTLGQAQGWWRNFYRLLGREGIEWGAWEVDLYGVSLAVVDATPSELLQLNLRRIHLALCTTSPGANLTLRVGSLSCDKYMRAGSPPTRR